MWEKTAGGQHSLISGFSPFITAWVPSTTSFQCSRERKTRKSFLSFTTVSLFILPFCVCVQTQHNCSISSGFGLCYPFKKKNSKQDFGYHCPGDTLCWQQTFFMQAAQKPRMQSIVHTGEVDKSVYENNKSTVKALKNGISSFNFRMCCSTNARSTVCHQHFTNYAHFSHATMLPEPSVIQMKLFQQYHPKHENLTIYPTDSQASISCLIQN